MELIKMLIRAAIESFPIDLDQKERLLKRLLEKTGKRGENKS